METKKVAAISQDMQSEYVTQLSKLFPNLVKEGVVNFAAFKEFFGEEGALADAGQEQYGLSWRGKGNAFKAIRTPSLGTLVPQIDEGKNWDETENVFIEGDNLEVLKLLQKHYRGKIKMIYIDPPYNTGKDFIYTDNFTEGKSDYYERTGQSKDGIKLTSNLETNGRFHSDWLTMMYPRLFLGRELLREDGVIFVSIDDNEVANLRLIMDEIFGEENFHGVLTWKNRTKPKNIGTSKYSLQPNIEYVLVYGKQTPEKYNYELPKTYEKSYPHHDEMGDYRFEEVQQRKNIGSMRRDNMVYELFGIVPKDGFRWQLSKEKFAKLLSEQRIIADGGRVYRKIYTTDEDGFSTEPFWSYRDTDTAENAKEELEQTMEVDEIFDTVKPTDLLLQILAFMPSDAVVLDFFAGSGTTAHAVMAQNAADGGNRKFICVQIPEETDENSEAHKAGYKTIADISRERIRRAGEKIIDDIASAKIIEGGMREVYGYGDKEIGELKGGVLSEIEEKYDVGFKSFKLTSTAYRPWKMLGADTSREEILAQMKLHIDSPLMDGYTERDIAQEVALKEGFSLNAKITQEEAAGIPHWRIEENDKLTILTLAPQVDGEALAQATNLTKKDTHTLILLDTTLTDTTKQNIGRNYNLKTI